MSLTDNKILPKDFLQGTGQGECSVRSIERVEDAMTLDEMLVFARKQKASDVHLSSGAQVIFRQNGAMVPVTVAPLTGERIVSLLAASIPLEKWDVAKLCGDLEFVHAIPGAGRFRLTVTCQRFGWDATARVMDINIRSFEDSHMPIASYGLTKWAQGLVLLAGPAGCGKSSTLATLIEVINQTREEHIITIENPIETVYEPKRCQITQREVGLHTLSSANALRAALREDPDIIVVSELRDLETIQLAVTAAETGHLVFGTMNTNDAAQTVTSLVNYFSSDEQPIIRNMVAESLRGVICQQLIPRLDGEGVVPAYEVLIMNAAAASLIKSDRSKQLNNVIATGKTEGMTLLDNSLQMLVKQGIIDGREAYRRAISRGMFAQFALPGAGAPWGGLHA